MQLTRDDDHGGAVLNCAVRYALGRRTYVPGLVMGELRPMLKDCNDKTLHVFAKDIESWLRERETLPLGYYGPGDHVEAWERFRDDVLQELERRSE